MADEFKTSQRYSKDADPNIITIKDERTFDSMEILGTEDVANQQAGRKPGRGSKRLSHVEAETGLMYRSDTKPRVIAGSTVFAIEKVKNRSKGMLQIVKCWIHESPAQEFIHGQVPLNFIQVSFRCEDTYLQACHTKHNLFMDIYWYLCDLSI